MSVSCPSDNKQGPCPAHLNDLKSKMGLIVLQEWWGLNDQIKGEAAKIGKMGGFTTIVPDLYRGKTTIDNEEANHLMSNLDWPGAIEDIKAAAIYLKKNANCSKVGVTGFCMGGALSLAAASMISEIDAAAPFYGIPGPDFDLSKIRVPLQCHFGKLDTIEGFSSPKDYNQLKGKCSNAKKFDLFEYDAGHAFTNETSENYNPESCELALNRLVKFMKENLS
ncbi:hypothetical protein KUTeg_000326 [Tegillarca granosa]|uniref:Dienelactone hydrolase domain-containing protein n=1 Tax=Tegillarca granosa TaxID=220873 RepID=A0ABQ9G1M0_TEGGR|nr:hypothetical protein KUTeg_000326 [Tegillarca granosa]